MHQCAAQASLGTLSMVAHCICAAKPERVTTNVVVQMDIWRCATLAGVQHSLAPLGTAGTPAMSASPTSVPCLVAPTLWGVLAQLPATPTALPLVLHLMLTVSEAISTLAERDAALLWRNTIELPTAAGGQICVELQSRAAAIQAVTAMAGHLGACVQRWAASAHPAHLRTVCLNRLAPTPSSDGRQSSTLQALLRVRMCAMQPLQAAAAALLHAVVTQTAATGEQAGAEANKALAAGLQTLQHVQEEVCATVDEALQRNTEEHSASSAAAAGLFATLQLLAVLAVALPLQERPRGRALLERAWEAVLRLLRDIAGGAVGGIVARAPPGLLEVLLRLLPILWLQLRDDVVGQSDRSASDEVHSCLEALLKLPLAAGPLRDTLKEVRRVLLPVALRTAQTALARHACKPANEAGLAPAGVAGSAADRGTGPAAGRAPAAWRTQRRARAPHSAGRRER